MRWAYVNNSKTEAQPNIRGVCPCCGGETIAKCGRFKINHWAHKDKTHCDPWWENESEWHRSWKNHFPAECQEVTLQNPTTLERHIADVYTPTKCVIEIQSYPIDDIEARAREAFYGNMIWIINGSRNEFDKTYFGLSLCGPSSSDPMVRNIRWYGRSKLLAKWSVASKAVFFDFGVAKIWQLLSFDPMTKLGQVREHPKEGFVEWLGGKCN